jgi:tetratricopeptide (TPR) repeat protein
VLNISREADDKLLIWLGHWSLGFNLFALGEYADARDHLAEITSSYKHQHHHQPLVMLHASDPGLGALAYESCCLWALGYPDQAFEYSQKALDLAKGSDHPFSLADVLCYAGCMFSAMRRDDNALYNYSDELVRLSSELNYRGWLSRATSHLGSAQVKLGQVQEGIKNIKAGIAVNLDDDAWLHMSGHHCFLAEAYGGLGQPGKGLQYLDEALDWVEKTGEHHWEVEAFRLKGELQLMEGDEVEAETNFCKAIEIARGQRARSWELRATMSLARLWYKQGRTADAQRELAAIYNWFTEGFDTPDLIEAKSLIEKLSINPK